MKKGQEATCIAKENSSLGILRDTRLMEAAAAAAAGSCLPPLLLGQNYKLQTTPLALPVAVLAALSEHLA